MKIQNKGIEEYDIVNDINNFLLISGSNSLQLCCGQSITEQSDVGANTSQLCCGEIYSNIIRPVTAR